MPSDGGISAAQAERIAYAAARDVVSPVANSVAQLERAVNQLNNRVRELENEMTRIASAIDRMSSELSKRLGDVSRQMDSLNNVAARQLNVQEQHETRTTQVLAATTAGFTASTLATTHVGNKVDRGTSAAAELEYLRQFNDAKAPLQQIKEFSTEVVERFAAAVESVSMNRMLYDEHFARLLVELDNKMHTVGDHIFRVVQEDFEPAVARRVEVPRMRYHEAALITDVERTRARARALESDLGKTFTDVVQPLLTMQNDLEARISGNYALPGVSAGEVAVPFDIVRTGTRVTDVACATDIVRANDGLQATHDKSFGVLRDAILRGADDLIGSASTRPLTPEELERVIAALRGLAQRGAIDATLLDGYIEALRSRPIHVAVDSEVNLSAPMVDEDVEEEDDEEDDDDEADEDEEDDVDEDEDDDVDEDEDDDVDEDEDDDVDEDEDDDVDEDEEDNDDDEPATAPPGALVPGEPERS